MHPNSLEGLWANVHSYVEFSHGKLREDFRFLANSTRCYQVKKNKKKQPLTAKGELEISCVFLHWNTTATHNDCDPVMAAMCLQYVPLSQFI